MIYKGSEIHPMPYWDSVNTDEEIGRARHYLEGQFDLLEMLGIW